MIEHALQVFSESEEYGNVLRAKGMVPSEDGTWIYYDLVEGDYEMRNGEPDVTGRLVVIGTDLKEDKLAEVCVWYGGYQFGQADILNPWSVINYIDDNFEAVRTVDAEASAKLDA